MPRRAGRTMPKPTRPTELAARWRAEADVLRRRGGEALATSLESCAQELEVWAREWALERLTLAQASEESGFSYSTLQHLVAARRIKNAGTKHSPRIRRADLPRKLSAPRASGPQLADKVLAARQRRAS